jgi:hypothetical protein
VRVEAKFIANTVHSGSLPGETPVHYAEDKVSTKAPPLLRKPQLLEPAPMYEADFIRSKPQSDQRSPRNIAFFGAQHRNGFASWQRDFRIP